MRDDMRLFPLCRGNARPMIRLSFLCDSPEHEQRFPSLPGDLSLVIDLHFRTWSQYTHIERIKCLDNRKYSASSIIYSSGLASFKVDDMRSRGHSKRHQGTSHLPVMFFQIKFRSYTHEYSVYLVDVEPVHWILR